MLENYLPVLVFIVIGVLFGVVPVMAGWLLGLLLAEILECSPE